MDVKRKPVLLLFHFLFLYAVSLAADSTDRQQGEQLVVVGSSIHEKKLKEFKKAPSDKKALVTEDIEQIFKEANCLECKFDDINQALSRHAREESIRQGFDYLVIDTSEQRKYTEELEKVKKPGQIKIRALPDYITVNCKSRGIKFLLIVHGFSAITKRTNKNQDKTPGNTENNKVNSTNEIGLTLDIFEISSNELIFHTRNLEDDTVIEDGILGVIRELLEELRKTL